MSMTLVQLEAEVLKLPFEDQARLADVLLASLESEECWEEAWLEIERRYEEMRTGKEPGIPIEQLYAQVYGTTRGDADERRHR